MNGDEFYEKNGYRESAEVEDGDEEPAIEDGLRDVLNALTPFNTDDTTRILLAVAALYDLPIKEEDGSGESE